MAAQVASGGQLVVLDGFVLDVSSFAKSHPGGEALLKADNGADITEKFKGAVYAHSNAARNLACTYRVARVQGYWS